MAPIFQLPATNTIGNLIAALTGSPAQKFLPGTSQSPVDLLGATNTISNLASSAQAQEAQQLQNALQAAAQARVEQSQTPTLSYDNTPYAVHSVLPMQLPGHTPSLPLLGSNEVIHHPNNPNNQLVSGGKSGKRLGGPVRPPEIAPPSLTDLLGSVVSGLHGTFKP